MDTKAYGITFQTCEWSVLQNIKVKPLGVKIQSNIL